MKVTKVKKHSTVRRQPKKGAFRMLNESEFWQTTAVDQQRIIREKYGD